MNLRISFLWRFLTVLLWPCLLGACVSQKQLPYLQSPNYSSQTAVQVENEPPAYRLQPGDVLSIRVQSTSPANTDLFSMMPSQNFMSGDPSLLYISGYTVDETGGISLPTAGRLKVSGLTVELSQQLIQKEVRGYVKDANVSVKLISFRLTILGEVRAPGRYFVYGPQATVLEGLGLAGDLTEFGNRSNVKLVRQTAKGSEVILLDLTDPNLLRSKYYYLLPNDALYVEPLKARTDRANANNLGLVFSALSAVVLLLSFITAK